MLLFPMPLVYYNFWLFVNGNKENTVNSRILSNKQPVFSVSIPFFYSIFLISSFFLPVLWNKSPR